MNAATATLPKPVLTLREIAQVLRCSLSTAKKLVASGALPSIKIGGLRRVRTVDLEAYIAALPISAEPVGEDIADS